MTTPAFGQSAGSYQDFMDRLAQNESGGSYHATNSLDYLGKYQFGTSALVALGYVVYDGYNYARTAQAYTSWTGKDGVYSREDFLNSPTAQENAERAFNAMNWKYMQSAVGNLSGGTRTLQSYLGTTVNGVFITESGLLAGAALGGATGVARFLTANRDTSDIVAPSVTVGTFIRKFAGYDTPFGNSSAQASSDIVVAHSFAAPADTLAQRLAAALLAGNGAFSGPLSSTPDGGVQAVFKGGSVDQLEAAAKAVGASAVWLLDSAGTAQLLIVGGPEFIKAPFRQSFPHGFAGPTVVALK